MKHTWSVLLLLAAACAAPPPWKPTMALASLPAEPSAFDAADSGREPETRRYRIRPGEYFADNAEPKFDFVDPEETKPPGAPPPEPATLAVLHAARVIRAMVAPESWDADPRRAVFVEKDELVVRHAPEVLDRVDRLIETLKAHRNTLVRFTVRRVSIPIAGIVGVENLHPVSGGLAGVFARTDVQLLDPSGFPVFGVDHAVYPSISVFAGQASHLFTRQSMPYVEGYLLLDKGWTPKVAVLHQGLTIRVRAVPNGAKSEQVLFTFEVERRELKTMRNLSLGAGLVQVPVVEESRTSGRFVVGLGQALLVVPHPAEEHSGRPEALMVEAESFDMNEK